MNNIVYVCQFKAIISSVFNARKFRIAVIASNLEEAREKASLKAEEHAKLLTVATSENYALQEIDVTTWQIFTTPCITEMVELDGLSLREEKLLLKETTGDRLWQFAKVIDDAGEKE